MNALLPRLPYREVWVVDFEFIAEPGERPDPVCLVARELLRGQLVRLWRDELSSRPPYSVAADSLFVAYFASAEIGCHLKLVFDCKR
jgi:DNA polymerase I